MAIVKYKPTSNGRRNMSTLSNDKITKTKPEKSLLAPLNKKGGRKAPRFAGNPVISPYLLAGRHPMLSELDVFATLIRQRARRFAGRLTGRLALAAARLLFIGLQAALDNRFDMLHCNPSKCNGAKLIAAYRLYNTSLS